MDATIHKDLKHNLVVNLVDGSFFGFASGFASFVTILPLFVSTMTDSAMLIGLIPAIHNVGWLFPQLLTADRVSRQARYKPMTLLMTTQERLPYLGLALVAWSLPRIGNELGLTLTFILLIWQGLGAGLTATAWQSMIGKIMPSDRLGSFFGVQSAAANLLAAISAVLAGSLLSRLDSPTDFVTCFLLSSLMLGISWGFLALTREQPRPALNQAANQRAFWSGLRDILRRDHNFRWFIVMRMFSHLGIMGSAFYSVYAVNHHGMNEIGVGAMTATLLVAAVVSNPLMGWLGDKFGHRFSMRLGACAAILGSLTAYWAPTASWFFLVFILHGVANAAVWTVAMAMIMDFGTEAERPAYIGLGNTLVSPATILAPLLGGWLAELGGIPLAFLASAAGAVGWLALQQWLVKDPKRAFQMESQNVELS